MNICLIWDFYYFQVTPASRHALTYDEESWKPTPEELSKSKEDTCTLERHQSTTKKVRNYLKKCRNVLSSRSTSTDQTQNADGSTSSWYVDKQINVHECQVVELEDVFENAQVVDIGIKDVCEVANIVEVKGRTEVQNNENVENSQEVHCEDTYSSPTLTELQGQVEEIQNVGAEVNSTSVVDEGEKQTVSIIKQGSQDEPKKEDEETKVSLL